MLIKILNNQNKTAEKTGHMIHASAPFVAPGS